MIALMGEFRYDLGNLQSPTEMPNGWLRVDGYLTRAGVFEYVNHDGSKRLELRPDDEVFRADSLSSFAMVPVTDDHPDVVLDSSNTAKYQKGSVSEAIRRDGDALAASMLITDGVLAGKMRAGKCGLSCGYEVDLEKTSGTHPVYGRYDAVQRNIRGNHVAVVSAGRAGPVARVRMDAAVQVDSDSLHQRSDMIQKHGGKWCVYSADGSKRLGEYDTEEEAKKRLGQIEAHKTDGSPSQPRAKNGEWSHGGSSSHMKTEHGNYEVQHNEGGGHSAYYKPNFVAPPAYKPHGTHEEKMAQYSEYMKGHNAANEKAAKTEYLGRHSTKEEAVKAVEAHHEKASSSAEKPEAKRRFGKKDAADDQAPGEQAMPRTIGVVMDEEMKAALADAAAQKARADILETELGTQRSRADKAEGASDALRAQLTEAETKIRVDGPATTDLENQVKVLTLQIGALKDDLSVANDPERRRADVRSRVKLETAAAAIFNKKFNADAMDDGEIVRAVLEKLHGPIPKDRSDEYLRARFDAAVENFFANEAALVRARDAVRTDEVQRADQSARSARQRMIDHNRTPREEK
jgi:hypothetical protein